MTRRSAAFVSGETSCKAWWGTGCILFAENGHFTSESAGCPGRRRSTASLCRLADDQRAPGRCPRLTRLAHDPREELHPGSSVEEMLVSLADSAAGKTKSAQTRNDSALDWRVKEADSLQRLSFAGTTLRPAQTQWSPTGAKSFDISEEEVAGKICCGRLNQNSNGKKTIFSIFFFFFNYSITNLNCLGPLFKSFVCLISSSFA